jgi:hypothetical protein
MFHPRPLETWSEHGESTHDMYSLLLLNCNGQVRQGCHARTLCNCSSD